MVISGVRKGAIIHVYLDIPDGKGGIIDESGAIVDINTNEIILKPQGFLSYKTGETTVNGLNEYSNAIRLVSADHIYKAPIHIDPSHIIAWELQSFNKMFSLPPYCSFTDFDQKLVDKCVKEIGIDVNTLHYFGKYGFCEGDGELISF